MDGFPRRLAGQGLPPASRRNACPSTRAALPTRTTLAGRARADALLLAGLALFAGRARAQEAVSLAPAVPPIAGGLLPATGADPSSPTLGSSLLDAFGQSPAPAHGTPGPAWQFNPSLLVTESLTDNPNTFTGFGYGLHNHRDDAVTQITPSIVVNGNGERFQVNLNYAPTGVIYAVNTGQSDFRQFFDGHVLAIMVPDLAFFDLRGNVSQVPVYGGIGVAGPGLLPSSQRETQSNISATPYLAHSFGGTGTLQAGVGYLYSATEAPDYLNSGTAGVPEAVPFNYGSRWLATRRAYASFTTGENYGRFQDEISTDNSFYDGSSALRDARRVLVVDDVSYAFSRFIAALGEFGYENLSYPRSDYRFAGGVWSAGVRITPNDSSSVTIEYRRIDGITAPYIFGYYQITPRLRVFGSYSQGITTFEQDQQNSLLSSTTDVTGAAASALVAAPLLNSAQLFGANQSLNHVERALLTATYIAGRNTITASYSHQRQSMVGNLLNLSAAELARLGISEEELAAFGLLTTQTSDTSYINVSWQHEWTPDITSTVLVGYNRNHAAETTFSAFDSAQFSVSVNKVFTETLSGSIAYYGNRAIDGSGVSYSGQNNDTLLISVRKSF